MGHGAAWDLELGGTDAVVGLGARRDLALGGTRRWAGPGAGRDLALGGTWRWAGLAMGALWAPRRVGWDFQFPCGAGVGSRPRAHSAFVINRT